MRRITFFLQLFAWFSLRHMIRHRWRAVAVICGIALGAAVFTSVRLAVHASMDSFTRSMDTVAGRADHVVVNPGGRVPEDLVRDLFQHPAIASISPVLSTHVMPDGENSDPFLLMGIDPILDRPFREWDIDRASKDTAMIWLDMMRIPGSLLISQKLADLYALNVGDRFTLTHSRSNADFQIVGILADQGLALAEGGLLAICDIAAFQEFTGLSGVVDRIDLVLKEKAAPSDIKGIQTLLQPKAILADPSESKKSGQQLIQAYQLNLSVLGFASLFVGMFLVYSLIALNATARRQELAVLRSLGASNQMVFQLFLTEGLLLGMAGWLIAIPSSSLLISIMLDGISKTITTLFVRVNVNQLSLSPWEILISFGVTLSISALAAYIPARQAMRVEPREVLSPVPDAAVERSNPQLLVWISLVCLALIVPLCFLPGISGFPLPGYLATLLLFVGFALIAPFSLRLAAKIAAPLVSRFFQEPGKLALRYITQSGTRTAVSVGALITAVALFTALVIMIHSFRKTVEIWVEQTVSGDLFVSPRMAELNQDKDPLDKKIIELIKQYQKTVDAVPLRRFHLTYSGVRFQLEATDLKTFAQYGRFLWIRGDPAEAYARAMKGHGVLISEVMAARTGLGLGDSFETIVTDKTIKSPVVGIIRDYRTNGGVVFCSLDFLNRMLASPGSRVDEKWSGVRLFVKQPDNTQTNGNKVLNNLRNRLLLQAKGTLNVTMGYELRQKVLKIFDETFAVTFILLLIAVLVATLGIATTMTILVLERAQQLNTLVAVGADQSQIRRMIFWESGFMVMVGEVLGLGCGFILSYLLVYVINSQSFGWTFLYQVNWQYIWISLPLIFGTAFFAAIPAIHLVFRMPPADLLRERAYG